MSDDLNTEIKIGADASGVEAGVGRAKRSLASLGDSAKKAGQDAGAGIGSIGAGGEKAARDVERATKNIQGQLQRAVASFEAGEKGSRKFYESIARQRGVDVNTLKPLLDQLDAYKAKSEAAAQASVKASTSFTGLGTAAGLAARAVAAIGIGASVGEFVRMADASTNVASRLGLVTSSAAELASVQQRLFGIAQSSRVSFTDLVGTYAQVARSTKDLGVSQTALLGVIQTISQAVTISGGSAASAQAALTQLSQGFASGALRGEELNSILEQTPRLAQALADGLGVGIGQLREMGKAGELTSEKVLGALEKSAASVAAEFGKMAVTVEQASTNAANSVLKLVGAFDRLFGVTSAIGGAIQSVSKGIDFLAGDVEKLGSQGALRNAAQEVLRLDEYARNLRNGMKNGVFNPNAEAQLARVNAQLAEAKTRFRELDQQLSGLKDPRDQTGFTGRGASYANEAARQAKLREDANAFRLNQSGVPASYLKDMAELIRLNQAGELVGKEYTDALKAQQDVLLKKTGAVKGSAAAANAEQNAYESLISSIRAKIEADKLEMAGGAALTESQRIRIKLDQDLAAGRVKLTAQNERAVRLALEELAASEASALAAKTLAKANLDAAASREKYLTSLSAGLDKIQADIAAQQEATARMGLSKQAVADLDAAKLEMLATDLELQAIKAMDRNLDQATYDALKEQAALYRDLAEAKKGGAAKEAALEMEKANAEAAKKAQEDWERASEKINDTLTDALMRGFESGKDFAKNLRDTVVNMFKTMVLRPVISAVVNPVAGAITGALGLAGAANAGTSARGAIGSAASGASFLGNAAGLLGGAGTAAGYGFSALMSGNGLGALSGGMSMLTSGGGAAVAAQGAGMMAGVLGPIALGIGLLSSLSKKKIRDIGIDGEFGGETGFEGQRYTYSKKWFRTKTEYSALEEEIRASFGNAFIATRDSIRQYGEILSLPIDGIDDFTSHMKLSLKGLNDQEVQEAFATAIRDKSNELAQTLIGSWESVTETVTNLTYVPSEYARSGEEAIDTLTRLATSLSSVNTIWDQLGNTLLDASLAGADAASRIADAFGGLDAMAATTGTYFQNFYSPQEQRAAVERQLNDALGKLNLTLPDIDATNAREQYRLLAEAQDRSTDEGLKAYVMLLQLSGAFASVTDAAQDAAQSLEQQRQSAYSALQKSVSAERDMLRARLDAAREVADTIGGVFDVLRTNVRELYGEVDSTRAMQAQQGNDFISKALATARSSGYLPDSEKLAEAIAAAREGLDTGNFGGDSAERDYAALVLAGKLSGLESIAGKQLTDAQRTVKELELQSGQLDQTLEYWKQQIDIASGTYEGILSVADAVDRLGGLMSAAGSNGSGGGKGGRNGGTPGEGAGAGWQRTSYGADEALTSFDKFKDWYNGLRGSANVSAMTDGGYDVPDWLRVAHMAADGTDAGMFGQYQFFLNNRKYAQDYEQIMTTGRSSYATDGSTLIRSDISKMPTDAAEYYKNNTAALLMAEGFLLDPVLAYQLYRDGPERFGIDRSKISFTEWLRSSQWSEEGVLPGDGADRYSKMDYRDYNLTKRDPKTGNLVGRDGVLYTSDGRAVGRASNDMMMSLYGIPAPTKPSSYITSLRQTFDQDIADGKTGQELADKIRSVGASMSDVADAYGITVEVLKQNLKIAGATDIPQFADGGLHAGGLRMVGERGWEIEATGPARIWNQRQLAEALTGGGNARLEALIEKLTAEVAELKAAAKSTAASSGQSASVLVAAQRGNSLSLVTEPTF